MTPPDRLPPRPPPPREGGPPRVLMVDGTQGDVAVLESVALAHGFEFAAIAATGDLVEDLRRLQPDVVLLDADDLRSPWRALCSLICAVGESLDLQVMVMTTRDDPEARLESECCAGSSVVRKPIDRQALALRLRSVAQVPSAPTAEG